MESSLEKAVAVKEEESREMVNREFKRQDVMMSGTLNDGESVGVPVETEYDRKQTEEAMKRLWHGLGGTVSLNGVR